jgi:hypothetical protein
VSNELPRPSSLTDGNGQPNGVNEAHKPTFPSSSPEPEPRTRPTTETITSDDKITFRRPAPTSPTKIIVDVVAPAPTPPPVTIQPPSPPSQGIESSLNAAHAQSLRQLMSVATTADECRVLVDMFLARVGFPVDRSTDVDPYPSPISSTDPNDVDLESSVIETLLGSDSSSGPSTVIHSAQPSEASQADESEVGTSDAETFDEAVDSLVQHSPSRIARDARVNHPPPSRHPATCCCLIPLHSLFAFLFTEIIPSLASVLYQSNSLCPIYTLYSSVKICLRLWSPRSCCPYISSYLLTPL